MSVRLCDPARAEVDDAIEFWLEPEMQQQPDFESTCSQIIVDLSLRSAVKVDGSLGFDEELFVDDHVEALQSYLFAFVANDDANFALHFMATCYELALRRCLVDVLEEPKAERIIDFIKAADNRPGQRLEDQILSRHPEGWASPPNRAVSDRRVAYQSNSNPAFVCSAPTRPRSISALA